ncbi:MAG TPA: protein kinase [Elusimicrobiota bacterium]|nr:protein kinase [Elusimicrobiota bacterium]
MRFAVLYAGLTFSASLWVQPGEAAAVPKEADGYRVAAQDALSKGEDEAAVEAAGKAIAAEPLDSRGYNLRAVARQRLGNFQGELEDAEAGLAADPKSVSLWNSKATALNRLNRYPDALRAADSGVAVNPHDYYPHFMRAQALAGMADIPAAIAELRRAADLNPGMYWNLQEAQRAAPTGDISSAFTQAKRFESSRDPAGNVALWAVLAGVGVVGAGVYRVRRRKAAAQTGGMLTPLYATPMPEVLKGQYKTGKRIGAGGMGLVFDGRDLPLDRRVAIKKMRDEIRSDPRERERFLAEAKLVATLHHPNIVDIYSILEEGPDVFLIFEFVQGKTLYEVLAERERFAFRDALAVMRGVAAALDYAHERGVIHRDLKPSNIMLDERGQAKVMDFGVARQAKDAMIHVMTNTIVGTPPYMAPEQEEGHVRRESDVYSMAVCLYEMLTGALPFAGVGTGMQINKKSRKYVPVSAIARPLPDGIDEVFSHAFEPEPDLRYRTAGEFAAALGRL